MITEQQQEAASLYALGALEDAEVRACEAEVRANSELARLVRELHRTADLLALAAPAVPPPPALKEKVLGRIDELLAAPAKPSAAALAGLRFVVGAAKQDWKALRIPGAYVKLLSLEKERGYAVLLGKLDPGVRYPAHTNAGPEDFYILTGDLVVGDRRLVSGDFHHAEAGTRHAENYSVEGCTLIAVLTTEDPLVAFAMG
jgi:anti-sigma factor ChrR (cupin superfamily)